MAVKKSPELHNWLLGLNFRIFTWQLNIGVWIETALDWAASWVNDAWSLAENAYNWARAAWDRAGELYTYIHTYIDTRFQQLLNRFESLSSYLGDWWLARSDQVRSWINSAVYDLKSYTNSILSSLNKLSDAWESFRVNTLPSLLSFTWFRSWWGLGSSTFTDWRLSFKGELKEERDAELQPLQERVRTHDSLFDMIRDLFEDPEKWLLDRLESMLARFI